MKLLELQKVLGDRIRIATNEDLPIEQRKEEAVISQNIAALAKQIINNADIVLRTDKLVAEGILKQSSIEKMIE